MNNNFYKDPIIERIRDILEKNCVKELKGRFYFGEPVMVAKNSLPLCFMEYTEQNVEDSAAFEITTNLTVKLTVAVDLTRDLTTNAKNINSFATLHRIVCGRNEKMQLLPDSIMGILVKNQDAGYLGERVALNLGGSGVKMEYGYGERGDGIFTRELSLNFGVKIVESLTN